MREKEGRKMRSEVPEPKVSVAMITYNHEPYIAQAVESVMMQETDFPYELVIGDDASTDRTRGIIEGLKQRFPDRIQLLPVGPNIGMNRNLGRVLSACRGEYVALLDGDDYWTSPQKLQKQAEFLDKHCGFAICFHNVEWIADGSVGDDDARKPPVPRPVATLDDILLLNFIPTASAVFRRNLFGVLPEWYFELPCGDWPLHILNAEHGNIGYLNEKMAVYRIHQGGAWSVITAREEAERILEMYDKLAREMTVTYSKALSRARAPHYAFLAYHHSKAGSGIRAVAYALRAYRAHPHGGPMSLAGIGRLARKPLRRSVRRWRKAF